jgi:hypothetical protein
LTLGLELLFFLGDRGGMCLQRAQPPIEAAGRAQPRVLRLLDDRCRPQGLQSTLGFLGQLGELFLLLLELLGYLLDFLADVGAGNCVTKQRSDRGGPVWNLGRWDRGRGVGTGVAGSASVSWE